MRTLPDGTREWLNDAGERHREGGPAAIVLPDGRREWRRRGKLHREDGPAIEHADSSREWWIDGERYDGDELEQRRRTWDRAARTARTMGIRQPALRELLASPGPRKAKTPPSLTPIDVVATSPAPAVEGELDVKSPEL